MKRAIASGILTVCLITALSACGNTAEPGRSQAIEDLPQSTGPVAFDEIVAQGQREVDRGYCPDIKPLGLDVADDDVIAVGAPTWLFAAPRDQKSPKAAGFSGRLGAFACVKHLQKAVWLNADGNIRRRAAPLSRGADRKFFPRCEI